MIRRFSWWFPEAGPVNPFKHPFLVYDYRHGLGFAVRDANARTIADCETDGPATWGDHEIALNLCYLRYGAPP